MKYTLVLACLLLTACSKNKSNSTSLNPNIFTFEQCGGVYDYSYKLDDYGASQHEQRTLKVSANGTIAEYSTTSSNQWTSHFEKAETPSYQLVKGYSYFLLSSFQSNTDKTKAIAVKEGNDGYFATGPLDSNGRHNLYWMSKDTSIHSPIVALRP